MPVLLADNIAFELRLSNGTQGIFRELLYDDQKDLVIFNMSNAVFLSNTIYVRKPLYKLVGINSSQVETSLDGIKPKIIPISLVEKDVVFLSNSCLVRFSSKDQEEKRVT